MNSRHLVDPELLPLLDFIPPLDLSLETLPAVRAAGWPLVGEPVAADAVSMTARRVPGPPGAPEVGVLIYTPRTDAPRTPMPSTAGGPLPCVLAIHGGGYVAGSAAELGPVHRPLALAAECVIVSVDYRLAPETPAPGAVEDCYAALGWVLANAAMLNIDGARVGVMGESAGGGLAAALALLCRDRGEYRLAFQHLIYPMLDDRTCARPDPNPFAGEFLWTAENNAFGWESLLGIAPGSPDVSCYAAPARASDLAGLPPAFISTGALDLFVEEDIEYARRLVGAGVAVELHVYAGAYHGFDLFVPSAAVARAANRDSLAALRRALHGKA
jgi:triacylglycerol lipase